MTKEKLLKLLENDRIKDNNEIDKYKKDLIRNYSLSKERWFEKPKKLTLWEKLKIILSRS